MLLATFAVIQRAGGRWTRHLQIASYSKTHVSTFTTASPLLLAHTRAERINEETVDRRMASTIPSKHEGEGEGEGPRHESLQKNVLGTQLEDCCHCPKTGYFRNGFCEVASADYGVHAVCAVVTEDFLRYTKSRGNDLSSPAPRFGFPGLKPGDKWCLCASRWKEAMENGVAPPVVLKATNEAALNVVSLDDLKRFALDLD